MVALVGDTAKVKATAELNPFREVTVIFDVPLFPAITIEEVGDAPKLKSIKVKLYVAVWVVEPDVPVTVTV
jgi:hypothetical protein